MAFLDNSGDIILDAVLTDAGRQRMARGDFKIVKFALGDEEINYENFNSSHPSGSSYYDLDIMQTPILEAFTNNTSLMKTKLLSLNRNNVLFIPKLAINDKSTDFNRGDDSAQTTVSRQRVAGFDGFFVLADENTVKNAVDIGSVFDSVAGVIPGTNAEDGPDLILIDQGIDGSGELPITTEFPSDLEETAYMVKVDHRLIRLQGKNNALNTSAAGDFEDLTHSFVDDDAVATYYISTGDPGFKDGTTNRHVGLTDASNIQSATNAEAFNGPLATRLAIAPRTSNAVKNSDGFFNELGVSTNTSAKNTQLHAVGGQSLGAHKYIDTIINVVGVTTGYALDIPIRIIKKS